MKSKSAERFNEIIKVFAFYGFGILIDSKLNHNKKSPENLRKAFESLGPTFIKIGQILSTRTDILPEEYINELRKLQDSAREESYDSIKNVFEVSLNKKVEEYFLYFNKNPMAAASIAQVHEGILKDGREVVIKIQRPNIYEKMKIDISILKRIVKFTRIKIDIKVVDILEVLEDLEESLEKELDFLAEGKNIKKFKENNKNVTVLYVPQVIEELWSSTVLTLEKINGFKINDRKKLKEEGYFNSDVARKLALCYCKQVFEDGFFHGDPHPGNILIFNGKLCFVDFGIMGELNENMKSWLNDAMFALATKDKKRLIEFILSVGIKRGKINRGSLYDDIGYLFDNYITTSLKNIKIEVLFQEVFTIAMKNNIQLPRELVSLVRGIVILEGVIAEVDPEVDIFSIVISFVKSKSKSVFLKEIKGEELLISVYSFVRDIIRIPTETLEVLNSLESGRSKINLHITDLNKALSSMQNMVNRITGGLVIAALIMSSSLIICNKVGPTYYGLSLLGVLGYLVSGILAVILLVSMIRAGDFRRKDK
ncbi:AarF/ABC1/UbiB kinase family protein [Clostridium sp. SHJSY1]|uniref:ABC1 kinase family protein n=1 Tax=Clostridium sp. SHJSY1 TaxID=2942483 RepID=UPI0028749F10|nr:AarF/ABC1/UbiB kinase family protein [Clostridium sp. SHJSY1]MDS0525344.1 AarF/ABC1/UbiB kinase family protein [Clostridium sp. SHJSY1]